MAIMFVLCLMDWEYGFYQLVRFLGMIGFLFLGYVANTQNEKVVSLIWFASALLINPLIKISLGRHLWNTVDVIWAIFLIGSMFFKPRKS